MITEYVSDCTKGLVMRSRIDQFARKGYKDSNHRALSPKNALVSRKCLACVELPDRMFNNIFTRIRDILVMKNKANVHIIVDIDFLVP